MVINKIGQQHIDYGTNCQDYGIEFNGMKVPDVLLSGNHAAIAKWRDENSLKAE